MKTRLKGMKELPAIIQNNYGEGQANQFHLTGGDKTFNIVSWDR